MCVNYLCVCVCVWSDVDRMLMPIIFLPSQQNTVNTLSHVTCFCFLPCSLTHLHKCKQMHGTVRKTACLLACCLAVVPLGYAQLEILPYFTLDIFFLHVNCVSHIFFVVVVTILLFLWWHESKRICYTHVKLICSRMSAKRHVFIYCCIFIY